MKDSQWDWFRHWDAETWNHLPLRNSKSFRGETLKNETLEYNGLIR